MSGDGLREFERALRAGIDPVAVPSVAYGIAHGEETLLLGAAGLADKGGVEATTRTPYALASVTKPMTAMATLRLTERGLVDLDAPLSGIASRAGDARAATVRRVLNHTAGLPLHYRFYYADEDEPRKSFEETVRHYAKTLSVPGERHQYSNLGYGLLDDLIALVSGVPCAEFMATEVFEPLGMVGATIGAPEGAAVAYGPDGIAYPRYDTDHPGGSAAFASVEDLLAFGRFHLSDPLTMTRKPELGYGLGWGVTERFGQRLVQHTGAMGGVSSILRLVPALDLVIAVVVNGESSLPSRAADDAVALFDDRFRQRLQAERATPAVKSRVPIPDEARRVWSGIVETGERLPFSLEILDGERALARLDGQESLVEGLRLERGRIVGVFDGNVDTQGANRRPNRLHLDLALREGRLDGAVTAITEVPRLGGAPGRRLGNALGYWAELAG